MKTKTVGTLQAVDNAHVRAGCIEKIVRERYLAADTDAADLALDEIFEHPGRTNDEIARVVAQRIQQA